MLDNETKRRIDTARDILVGKVPDPKSQVEQITVAMIYKFMDDMDLESIELGGEPSFFTGEYKKYAWRELFNPAIGGNERLLLYSEAIVQMNLNPNLPQLFRDIFKNAYLPYRDPETLTMFLKIINDFKYDHSERLGDAFEYLLSVLGSQGDAGQFRTPRHIIDFMAAVIQPQKQERIGDPACGTAGFLIASYKHILEQNKGQLTPNERITLSKNLIGYDISPDMVRLSLVNLYLHGFRTPNVFEYDTLTSQDRWSDYFDVILANPPFMSPKGGITPHSRFGVKSNRSEVLFVDYIAEHLKPEGRAAVIVPEGVIFQSGTAYKALRRFLVENKYLYAVVSLPAGIFQPYSGVKTSILLMDKGLAKKTDNILFVKINGDGFDLGAQRRANTNSDLPDALQLLNDYKIVLNEKRPFETDSPLAVLVSKEKIGENGDYNLSPDRYKVVDNEGMSKFEMVKLGDVCEDFRNGVNFSKEQVGKGVKFVNIKDLFSDGYVKTDKLETVDISAKEIERNLLQKDDILFVRSSVKYEGVGFNSLIDPKSENIVFCGFIIKATPKKSIVEPKYLNSLLRTDEFRAKVVFLSNKANITNISQDNLKQLEIPLPPLSIQREIVNKIESYQRIIDGAKQVVNNYKPMIEVEADWEMVALGEVVKITSGGTPSREKEEYWNGEIPWVKTGQINFNLITEAEEFITQKGMENSATKMIPKGTILMAMYGQGVTRGKVAILGIDATINQACAAIMPNFEKINQKYLFYLLQTKYEFLREISDARGGNQSNLNAQVIKEIQIPLPPLSIQAEIVAQIEREQSLVHANKELIQLMEGKIQAAIGRVWR